MTDTNNRELSWLAFNRRVLQEAGDATVPLLQRLRFLGIYSNNKDEFFRVRVAKLIRLAHERHGRDRTLSGGFTAGQLLEQVNAEIAESEKEFAGIYSRLLVEMEEAGIRVVNETMLSPGQKAFCRDYFASVVSRRLVPLFLRKSMTMPFLADHRPYLAVAMESAGVRKHRFAILPLPSGADYPRFVHLPSAPGKHDIIFQDDIIRLCLDDVFFMFSYDQIQAYTFKIMRDSLLSLDDDVSKSLREKMEDELEKRARGKAVRLVYDKDMPEDLLHTIAGKLKLGDSDLDAGGRYHMMRDLTSFPVVDPELENQPERPVPHPDIKPFSSILKRIAQKDILLSFPYHSFGHVIDLLREAAVDPKVENIAITLYRTADRSRIVNALVCAAQNGKKVTAIVELLARFDEERNVETIDVLQNAGVHVIHGAKDLKVHAKLILIERREQHAKVARYVYVGTGNFNEDTARLYSDMGLMTADPELGRDALGVFEFMAAMHRHVNCKKLMAAPYEMRKRLSRLIRRETANARKGKPAFIRIKCNSLSDSRIIRLLYEAGQAGVKVRLIVRGVCCLKADVPGLSDNIQAISIVDRYLEHARFMIFCNNGDTEVFISSADLMPRNLDRRLEVAAPILEKRLQKELLQYFDIQWSDNVKARDLANFGANSYVQRGKPALARSQAALHHYYATKASNQ